MSHRKGATEEIIAPEPEPQDKSDQVREPAAPSIGLGALVEIEGMVLKPVHTPTAEGELQLDLKKTDCFKQGDLIYWVCKVILCSCIPCLQSFR